MRAEEIFAQSMGMSGEQQGFPQNAEELQKRLFLLQTQGLEQQRQGIGQLEQQMAQRQQKGQVSPMLAILAGASDIYGGTQYGQQLLKQKSEAERQAEQDALRLQQLRGDLTGRETDLVRTLASNMREQEQFDEKMRLERAKLAKEDKQSANDFEKQYMRTVGKSMAEFTQNDRGTMIANLGKVDKALELMENNKVSGRTSLVPDVALGLFSEDTLVARDAIRSAITDTLRPTLGAQFTEKEGQRIMNLAYDEKLSVEKNKERARQLREIMQRKVQFQDDLLTYIRQNNGSDIGFPYENYGMVKPGTTPSASTSQPTLEVGAVMDGYRYKGGDRANPSSWEKVQ